jgi:hypothetical protein
VDGAALGAPAQLVGVREGGQVVDGHVRVGEWELSATEESWFDGDQGPGAGQGVKAQNGKGAAAAGASLGYAPDGFQGTWSEVAQVQQMHDPVALASLAWRPAADWGVG